MGVFLSVITFILTVYYFLSRHGKPGDYKAERRDRMRKYREELLKEYKGMTGEDFPAPKSWKGWRELEKDIELRRKNPPKRVMGPWPWEEERPLGMSKEEVKRKYGG
ncbi:hypothetical protein [Mesorhizobium sp.]|uniref:hypothetical protein n=1 Tax=Mesorhizobium sp. TaxID=1871066 RepID=UPI000FE97D64|nr:hypothetical protein [Mesorhizobium sp.]RWE86938.1 MAG: hypothetical protein EOS49_11790 [Mesorhizobium sp.]